MFQVNKTTNYNGNFLPKTSNKPLAGFLAHEIYLNNLVTAVNNTDEILLPGQLVEATTGKTQGSSLQGLNPNVLNINLNPVEEDGNIMSSVIVHSPGNFVMPGDIAPTLQNTQTTYLAMVGMGIELYLACDTTLLNTHTRVKLYYNAKEMTYTTTSDSNIQVGDGFVTLCSNVLEGQRVSWNKQQNAIFSDCYVIKVKL